jgi:peptide/nickel transport system substrate-binding protein
LHRRFVGPFILLPLVVVTALAVSAPAPQPVSAGEQLLITSNDPGHYGGHIVVPLRSEPKTLNPVIAADQTSRDVIGRMMADLVHINGLSQRTESALAESWKVSKDGLRYTLKLRRGLRFSDGQPMNADDVLFTFQVLLDEKANSPQRDLLLIGGKPIAARKVDDSTVEFTLPQPYAAAERLFDSMWILPRHRLEDAYRNGTLAQAWALTTPPSQFAGMGPFRLKEYVPSQKLVLERNPYYWKADRRGQRLPYLDEITFLFVASEDAQVLRFQAGEADMITRFSADNYAMLEKDSAERGFQLYDIGPSLETNFLLFNLNSAVPQDAPEVARHQQWFRDVAFRKAVSLAIDRSAIVRLVFHGRGTPLWAPVTPANKLWTDESLPQPPQSLDRAKELLRQAGYSWNAQGTLLDKTGTAVSFTILCSASNAQRSQMATLLQDDLKRVGMDVHPVPMEFRSMLDRVLNTHNYDAVIMGLLGGDVDPNSQINVWMSNGSTHLWDLGETKPATPWEAEIDSLMTQQLTTLNAKKRKQLFDRVQEIAAEQQPLIYLATPNVLVGARRDIGNLQPALLDHYTLWNVEQLYRK